jgi:DNA-directed RNA polymerase specialized sigma24 family protein
MMETVKVDRVESAYRQIHERLWQSLFSFTGDRDIASDAEVEAFRQVLQRGDAVDDISKWVWRAAFRIAGGMLSERRTAGFVQLNEDIAEAGLAGSTAEFLSLLGGLSTQQRECVVLRYVGQFTAGEIAAILETTSATVRVQLHRAHCSLRASIDPGGQL